MTVQVGGQARLPPSRNGPERVGSGEGGDPAADTCYGETRSRNWGGPDAPGPLRAERRGPFKGRRPGCAPSCAELAGGDVGRRLPGSLAGCTRLPAPPPGTSRGGVGKEPGAGGRIPPGREARALSPEHGHKEPDARGAPRVRAAGALSQTKARELRLLGGCGTPGR